VWALEVVPVKMLSAMPKEGGRKVETFNRLADIDARTLLRMIAYMKEPQPEPEPDSYHFSRS
jgi:hypothetical protein